MDVPESDHTRETKRLWTPWRMNYVGGGAKEDGCIFCNRLERDSDVASLILHRAAHTFVIMNLYPYNTGHIMLVPNAHASDPTDLSLETLAEMGVLLPTLTSALRRAFGCHGFNIGLNIGAIAGAGVEAHLHEHIVPRWQGDANFMPIIASTMTIPELIPVTYAKIRAELTREITGASAVRFVLLAPERARVLLRDGDLPTATIEESTPIIDAVADALPPQVTGATLTGWAGPDRTGDPQAGDTVLTMQGDVEGTLPSPWSFEPITLLEGDREATRIVQRALSQLAPAL